jgi:hypothetical protein
MPTEPLVGVPLSLLQEIANYLGTKPLNESLNLYLKIKDAANPKPTEAKEREEG